MESKEEIRTQWLTQGLVLSVILNVGLFVVCMFYALRQHTIDLTGSLPVTEVYSHVDCEDQAEDHIPPDAKDHILKGV